MREQLVVVGILKDAEGRFLVTFTTNGAGMPLPGRSGTKSSGQSDEDDLRLHLPHAVAKELDFIAQSGKSGRTGEDTNCLYWLFEVEPNADVTWKDFQLEHPTAVSFFRRDSSSNRPYLVNEFNYAGIRDKPGGQFLPR